MYEALQIVYTFIPKEILLIILCGLIMWPMLEYDSYKQKKYDKNKK